MPSTASSAHDVAAQRLGQALLSLGGDIHRAARANQVIYDPRVDTLDAARALDAWLWLWESHEGPAVAAAQGDAWLIPLIDRLSFNYAANRAPRFELRLPGNPTEEPSRLHPVPVVEEAALRAVMDRYLALLPAVHPPTTDLELFHLPMLVLLAHRPGARAPSPGTVLDPLHALQDPLGLLVRNQDLALATWWVNDPSFTAARLESYTIGHREESLLAHTIDSKAWVSLWLSRGVSPLGPAGLPVRQSPLFQAASGSAVQALLGAGADPDTRDEQGAFPEEYHEGAGRHYEDIHSVCQEARQALGRLDSVELAHWRYQFTRLALSQDLTHPGFAQALTNGPWPTLDTPTGTMGVLEYLARIDMASSRKQLRQFGKKWGSRATQLRRVHHDGLSDWAIAHAISAGALESPKSGGKLIPSALLPPRPDGADINALIWAWAKHAQGHTEQGLPAWADQEAWVKGLTCDHIPAVLALNEVIAQECLDKGLALNRVQLMSRLAAPLWEQALDPLDRQALWSAVMWEQTGAKLSSDTPKAKALAAATPAFWNHLAQTPMWKKYGATEHPDYVPHIRSARHQATPEDIGPRRARSRP